MMKKRIERVKAGKRAPWWALALLAGSFLIGCTKESLTPPVVPNPAGEQASVTLKVNTPQPTLPTALTRSQTADESRISAVKVLVFDTAGESEFKYMLSGTQVTSMGDHQTRFKIDLPPSKDPLKLVILTNANQVFSTVTLESGLPETEVRKRLNAVFSSDGLQGDLPMYGEIILADGVGASQSYELSVTVLRAVARVDVVKSLTADSPDFILEEVFAFRANDGIKLIPDALDSGGTPKVSAPSVPAGATALTDPVTLVQPGAESIIQLYLPESNAATFDEKINGATTIVIGGRFGGEGNPVTYYRADFNSGISGHPFGQILRNHRYIFNIKRVGAEGWPSPEDAANNLSSSMQVDVQTWEDFSSDMYLGDDRLGLSAREISLRYTRNRSREIDVESTLNYQIQWLDTSGNPTGSATSTLDETISNDNFSVKIVKRAGDTEYVSHLVFTTLNDNHLGDVISDKLRVTAGKWSIDVSVTQDNSEMYSSRYLSILTVEGVGNLGVNMLAPDASGLAMRKVLDKQFSPTGIIRIGGPSYTRILNNTNWVGTSASDNLFILKRLFGSQDVIYFPHAVSVSAEVAALLVEWLEENTHRVLIIGTDTDSSNKELRLNSKFAADGTWSFNPAAVTTTYSRGVAWPENAEFFKGPFGSVSPTTQYTRADAYAGYTNNRSADVTALITANQTGFMNSVFFGVNKKNRVVYHGDAQLFQTPQMSNDSGNVSSDLDKLMANTWAWIVEQVVYGED